MIRAIWLWKIHLVPNSVTSAVWDKLPITLGSSQVKGKGSETLCSPDWPAVAWYPFRANQSPYVMRLQSEGYSSSKRGGGHPDSIINGLFHLKNNLCTPLCNRNTQFKIINLQLNLFPTEEFWPKKTGTWVHLLLITRPPAQIPPLKVCITS